MIIAKEKSMGLWYLDSEIVKRIFFFFKLKVVPRHGALLLKPF